MVVQAIKDAMSGNPEHALHAQLARPGLRFNTIDFPVVCPLAGLGPRWGRACRLCLMATGSSTASIVMSGAGR